MTTRLRLPNRRGHEGRDIFFQGQRFSIGIGCNNISVAVEVFVSATKAGSNYDAIARDAGVLLSIALQSGADLGTVRRALTRASDGSAASLLGAIVDELGSAR
jgi:hypothetical protein